eukprot:CAMPEP_0116872164 /NCGR_PEP_ID=MMETSP0463-20121206/2850_1 /TAXON_ID=181622 /ORGANISM="Strombidinopsis sp, Strain SopsisLIS2011" /LENGTH=37 /DNA_ID= /DNA_START= /DNA_END= /DNA_ORIENTATION=
MEEQGQPYDLKASMKKKKGGAGGRASKLEDSDGFIDD